MSASSRRAAGSRFDEGSSSTRTSGSMASTVATATRRRWPKLRWCGGGRPVRHADGGERVGDPRVELVAAEAEVGRPERDVVAHRGHEQLVVGILEHDADPPADLLQVAPCHRQPADRTSPLAGGVDAVEVQHERGLAGAVGARAPRPAHRARRRGRRRAGPGDRRGRRRRDPAPRAPASRRDPPARRRRTTRRRRRATARPAPRPAVAAPPRSGMAPA